MIRPSQSIRWRIQAWHGLILLIAIAAFCGTAYQLAWQNQNRRINREIRKSERALVITLANQIRGQMTGFSEEENPPPLDLDKLYDVLKNQDTQLTAENFTRVFGQDAERYYYAFFDPKGNILLRSSNGPDSFQITDPHEEGEYDQGMRDTGRFRETSHTFPQGLRVLLGRDIRQEREDLRRHGLTLAGAGLAVWALGLLGGWWLTGKAIRPIQTISDTANRITEGNLKDRIQIKNTSSELGQLSQVLNNSFDRLQSMLEQQRQFTADASHELRTPLTIILSEAQRMQRSDRERSPQEYRDAFKLCYNAASRMQRLVESLLLLARQDTEETTSIAQNCPLLPAIENTCELFSPMAQSKDIVLKIEATSLSLQADPQQIEIVLN
jgi:methyl-accepting chemotaxis protein